MCTNRVKVYQFKAENSKLMPYSLFLDTILKIFTVNNMKKKTGLNGYMHVFSVDYYTVDVSDTSNFHIDLMIMTHKKHDTI